MTHLSCFNATEVLCRHALVIQALYEAAELHGILDPHTEQDVGLVPSRVPAHTAVGHAHQRAGQGSKDGGGRERIEGFGPGLRSNALVQRYHVTYGSGLPCLHSC